MPIYHNEYCRSCGENPNLAYICEACHEIFCEDCVDIQTEERLVCTACGSVDIEQKKPNFYACAKCQSTFIRTVKKIVPTCHKCHSREIDRIEQKQQNMIETYKEIITKTRLFLKPLEEVMDKLNKSRHILLQLRSDEPKCYHYPTLESDYLIAFKLFEAGKASVYEQVNGFFQEIQRNLSYVAEISNTHPNNLFYIDEILKFLERERQKIEKSAQAGIEPQEMKAKAIKEKIEFMGAVQSSFIAFQTLIKLDPNEKIVYALKCKLAESNANHKDYSGKNGTILISSKRLYFFHEQGVFKKKTVLLFSVLIEDLQQVGVKGRFKKQVSLDFVNSMYSFSISKESREEMIKWIEAAREFDDRNKMDMMQLSKLEKYKLSLKSFQDELENAIYELIGFHGTSPNGQSVNGLVQNSREMVNAAMYQKPLINQQPSMNAPYSDKNSGFQYSEPPILPYPGQQPNFMPRNRAIGRDQFPDIDESPENTEYGYHTPNSKTYITPAGHYGYPHDRNPTTDPRQVPSERNMNGFPLGEQLGRPSRSLPNGDLYRGNRNAGGFYSQDSILQRQPEAYYDDGYLEQEMPGNGFSKNFQGNSNPGFNFAQKNSQYRPSGIMGVNPHEFNRRSDTLNRGTNSLNTEQGLRVEINQLRQEEFALNQTVKALEERYDAGYITSAEFMKSYRELQKQMYSTQSQIAQLQKYLEDTFGLINN